MTTNMETTTRHKGDCGRVFRRYDLTCPRCLELQSGSKARKGWGRPAHTDIPYPTHPNDHRYDPNPGGYCMECGWGRDHS